jgi:hypothetical protein
MTAEQLMQEHVPDHRPKTGGGRHG